MSDKEINALLKLKLDINGVKRRPWLMLQSRNLTTQRNPQNHLVGAALYRVGHS